MTPPPRPRQQRKQDALNRSQGPKTVEEIREHLNVDTLGYLSLEGMHSAVAEFGPFVEVYVEASVEECARRDVKGLYEKAFAGEIKEFTGVSDPYEAPTSPDIVLHTEEQTPDRSAQLVLDKLEEKGLLFGEVRV